MKSKQKIVEILIITTMIYIILSIIISNSISVINPSLIFNDEYKSRTLNEISHTVMIDQFSVEGDRLTSITNDPKYNIIFDEPQKISSISFKISGLSKISTPMEVYLYSDEEEKSKGLVHTLVNGVNTIKLGANTGEFNRVRFDFVTEPNISLKVNENNIKLNEGFPFAFSIIGLIIIILGSLYLLKYLAVKYGENIDEKCDEFIDNLKQRNFVGEVKDFAIGFQSFLINNKYIIYSGIVLFLLCFLYESTNITISIDEEQAINRQDGAIWVREGRYGIYFFNKIFSLNNKYSMALSSLSANMLLVFSGIFLVYVINRVTKNAASKVSYILVLALFISFPYVNANYLSYSMYSVPVTLGILLTILSFGYVGLGYKSFALAAIPLTMALSIYQVFAPVFMVGTVVCMILLVMNNEIENVKKFSITLAKFIVVFFMSFIFYIIILKFVVLIMGISRNGYTSKFNDISTYSLSNVASIIMSEIKLLFLTYSNKYYSILMFLLYLIVVLKTLMTDKYKLQKKYMLLFLYVMLVFTPFAHTLIFNVKIPLRTLEGISILVAVIWFININYISKNKVVRGIVILIALFAANNQILELNKLFYVEEFRYTKELNFTSELIDDIMEVNGGYIDKPIVTIGQINQRDYVNAFYNTDMYMRVDAIGYPLFTLDTRLGSYLNSLGYNVNVSKYDGDEKFEDVPNWPSKEAIFIKDDVIYLKLGDI